MILLRCYPGANFNLLYKCEADCEIENCENHWHSDVQFSISKHRCWAGHGYKTQAKSFALFGKFELVEP